ncbi:MAG: ferredoxin family protein [Methanobacteriaceae archaeon]|jgi:2-oxoglutarate ferredoxin oxidoreductase subunit delta|nr:ferredoxin family protein [Methanobacteriaceae archaeon]
MISLDPKLCKGCDICTEFCPKKVYEIPDTSDKRGVRVPVPKNQEKCTKCKLCELMCPEQAIKVEGEDE